MRFDYWVIRYVPDPIRGERVNLGVIAGAADDWALRRVSTLHRASRLGGSAASTNDFLESIEASIETNLDVVETLIHQTERTAMSRAVLEDLRVRMRNIVQLSSPKSVLADTADDAADLAFELMVVDPEREVSHRSRTMVVRRLKAAFELEPSVVRHLSRYRETRVGEQRASIDVAVADDVARQLTQAWSFDVKDMLRVETQIHAWNYMMNLVRSEGGELRGKGMPPTSRAVAIPEDVAINVLYRAPTSDDGRRQLESASEGWSKLGISVYSEDQAAELVRDAKTLIRAR